jgi:hypothetical protein
MSKLQLTFFGIIMLINFSVLSQNRTVEVYSTQKKGSFIPYINGQQMTMLPVDTFKIDADTIPYIELLIHFEDIKTADLTKKINFDLFKHKKYEIVPTSYFISTLNDLDGPDASDTLNQVFMIKDRSAIKYIKKESAID